VKILTFNGDLDREEFFDYIVECDRVREYVSIIEEKMVKLFAYNLKGRAFFLWKCQTNIQLRGGRQPITFYIYTRHMLYDRFLCPSYEQYLFQRYKDC
jgi:hypothetical protein